MSLPQLPESIRSAAKPFSVVAKVTALDGKADELAVALGEAAAKAVKEDGVISYVPGREADKPSEFFVLERYASVEAFEAHGKGEALRELAGKGLIGGLYLHFIADL